MKVKARLYKGIEFVAIADLPVEQKLLIESSPLEPERIKILIDGKILENCVQYSKYVDWFGTVYASSVSSQIATSAEQGSPLPAKTA